ncbi:L-aspartate aminotransferase apoenzyme [Oceanithermus profundus DSM 14977]|uniref:Aminotransferase n=1 Tax=Oceanithermus profundus (strain DSM 14977 / NBRC 100410 / VKM B-2274 / 506) TaxID=670487 RepID=E4U597_OCEP5|nr:pyridoxal phosphate-dependent aminotransferase [Oceanithermus profundus]ADR37571.1 L-aspartate aminotransferase apoenzyme [Oceanithermus profundus DSM 14977]
MSRLSKRAQALKPSSTVAMNARALELRRQGVDVIALTAGEPDFDTPQHVKDAACQALAEGKTKYTPPAGIPELREALARKFERENGLSYAPDQITVGAGGKGVLYNLFQAILDPGDEVILLAPFWVSYSAQVELAGGVPVVVKSTAETGFVPELERVAAAVTERTKAIVVNSPSNPTGAVYPPELLQGLARLANDRGVFLVSDEIYEHLIYEGEAYSPGRDAPEWTITVGGAAKSYAMTGWRIGWAAGPKEIITAMTKIQGQSVTHPTTFAQWATIAALESPESRAFIEKAKAAFRRRRDFFVKGLEELGLPTPMPHGAFYVMPDVRRIHEDELKAAEIMLDRARVVVVPGTDFVAPGHVRMSYATSDENLERALERLAGLF